MSPTRSFGNPVKGTILPEGSGANPPQFRVTQGFNDEATQYGPHDGLDLGNSQTGDPILAMDDGEVYQAFFDSASGGAGIVRIDHGDGWTTGMAHMDEIYVRAGERVTKGQKVARLDNTGWSSGAHLHFDTTHKNVRQDPWPLLAQNQEGGGGGNYMGPWHSEDDLERLGDEKWWTKEGANFRKDSTTKAEVIEQFPDGQQVFPYARVQGQVVNDNPWWYLAILWADGAHREGYFHKSSLRDRTELHPEEPEDSDEAAASKAAADAVRDAGVAALNEAAKGYGA